MSVGLKKKATVTLSTCESVYYAMTLSAKYSIWIRLVLIEADLDIERPIPVRSDNQSAISWATGDLFPSVRANHIDVRVHFIRELVIDAILSIVYVPSEDNDEDVLTKPVGPTDLNRAMKILGLGLVIEGECWRMVDEPHVVVFFVYFDCKNLEFPVPMFEIFFT